MDLKNQTIFENDSYLDPTLPAPDETSANQLLNNIHQLGSWEDVLRTLSPPHYSNESRPQQKTALICFARKLLEKTRQYCPSLFESVSLIPAETMNTLSIFGKALVQNQQDNKSHILNRLIDFVKSYEELKKHFSAYFRSVDKSTGSPNMSFNKKHQQLNGLDPANNQIMSSTKKYPPKRDESNPLHTIQNHVFIRLTPKSSACMQYMLNHKHFPRLELKISVNMHLQYIVDYLETKWICNPSSNNPQHSSSPQSSLIQPHYRLVLYADNQQFLKRYRASFGAGTPGLGGINQPLNTYYMVSDILVGYDWPRGSVISLLYDIVLDTEKSASLQQLARSRFSKRKAKNNSYDLDVVEEQKYNPYECSEKSKTIPQQPSTFSEANKNNGQLQEEPRQDLKRRLEVNLPPPSKQPEEQLQEQESKHQVKNPSLHKLEPATPQVNYEQGAIVSYENGNTHEFNFLSNIQNSNIIKLDSNHFGAESIGLFGFGVHNTNNHFGNQSYHHRNSFNTPAPARQVQQGYNSNSFLYNGFSNMGYGQSHNTHTNNMTSFVGISQNTTNHNLEALRQSLKVVESSEKIMGEDTFKAVEAQTLKPKVYNVPTIKRKINPNPGPAGSSNQFKVVSGSGSSGRFKK